ncbi:pyruvate dehydrogenase (acetyl-transferring), homodimeric type [Achromobacter aloeverae]|uniref:Pyruvate dehydrogenase E1 component n=1 Tax=Achromobacter aloeverae TaxID=1750518 RepID=A0A4Q1HSD5_9BURK|nr:pyruvate dehydrogenase (acetyl-transferring), homodimeric type [Achromobacter aloeverae]RXN92875.1 pyruvate dehydrogenase (acetyl-transferring), homodimeric type [Achromobacter aloeverae]
MDASYIDPDPQETEEWQEAFAAMVRIHGGDRGARMLARLRAQLADVADAGPRAVSPECDYGKHSDHGGYVNSIPLAGEPPFPGDLEIEERLASLMRWNALAMVVKANQAYGELGGHIASYASAADLFEVGFNHFFHARRDMAPQNRGDLVFFQPHSAPGIYARAYLENRLTERDLAYFRREIAARKAGAQGLSSYPHPYLMPAFWQFPTGSMGIGPINSIYQARFMHYLTDRGILDCRGRRVWGVFGDGEMDEPESMAALTLAARENLDNLTWVVNCNLQRLDGPVRGNGKIIDELEKLFSGAGWHVIKVLWGSDWDPLFAQDATGRLRAALAATVDGQMQTLAAKDAAYNRQNFFGQSPEIAALIAALSDQQIDMLTRGGHDIRKIYAAYHAAVRKTGAPTVILAHTKKGFGMGPAAQGKMTTHSNKKLEPEDLLSFRDRFKLPLSDDMVRNVDFYKPAESSPEMQYLRERRQALGGALPARHTACAPVQAPDRASWSGFATQPGGKEMSTTMAFVRMLGNLLKDPVLGPRIVPIVADEARTFGMANLFKQVGIYSCQGQRYEPEDIGSILSYREATDGQILEEGISEAGAISSWTAAATSYSTHGVAMLPFYIYYSMFGFQRIGDLIWAAADQRPRGFLIGATSGRTTLGGEGLQHQDGTSHLWASTIPNCRAYDPAHAGELAVIIDAGMREMMMAQRDVFYYVTVMNENYAQPDVADAHGDDIMKGGYLHRTLEGAAGKPAVTLLGSGAIFREVLRAGEELNRAGHTVHLYSITSWSELDRDARTYEDQDDGAGQGRPDTGAMPHLHRILSASGGPIVAASDYVRLVPESIRAHIPAGRAYRTLGTDGFGRSDTRSALRRHFKVDAGSIADAARRLLA